MKNWMLFLAFLISATNVPACSWWPEGEDVRFSLFSSHLADGDDISELFYSAHLFNQYAVDDYSGPAENLNEWHAYFDGKFRRQSIDEVIYRYSYDNQYYHPREQRNINLSKNPLMVHFKNGGHKEAAEYILFAIKVEEELKHSSWEEEKFDVEELKTLCQFADEKMRSIEDKQIQLRYAYQLVVIYHYLGDYNKLEYYYKNYIVNATEESVLKKWAEFYYANILDTDHRLYHYSRVFDESKSKSRYIFQHFPSDKSKLKGAFKLCKNDGEKAAILSLLAFKNPGRAMAQIKEIAELNANDELLDILLIREINKMEDWYLTDRYTSYGPAINTWWGDNEQFKFLEEKNFLSDKNYLKSFKALCEDIVIKENVQNKGLWYTSIAYMAYMLDDEKETEKYLSFANKHADDPEIQGQLAVIELLHLVKYEDDWSNSFQQNIMNGVKKVEAFKDEIYRYERFHSQLMLAISRKYLELGELTLAALFETKVKGGDVYERYSGWYDDESGYQAFDLMNENAYAKDLDAFFEMWNTKKKTPLERWLFEDMEKYKWRMTDLWATAHFREDNLERALEIYKTIPDSIWQVDNWRMHYHYKQELSKDPFESNLYGRSYDAYDGKTYTKPAFVAEIIRLKKQLEGPVKDKAHYALLLGNAYYNMTYNGNSYYYTEYSWSGYEADDYARDQSSYYSSDKALEYYRLAEKWAPNDAYAAFCYRMQLKCKRDSYYNLEFWKDKAEDDWKLFNSKYPEHADKLTNCDHFTYYSQAWKQG